MLAIARSMLPRNIAPSSAASARAGRAAAAFPSPARAVGRASACVVWLGLIGSPSVVLACRTALWLSGAYVVDGAGLRNVRSRGGRWQVSERRSGCLHVGGAIAMLPGSLRRLAGNYAVPRARQPLAVWPALRATSRTRLAALAAPPDAVILDNVAALAQERYAEVVWVRLAAADTDPGALLLTLLGAVARRDRAAAAGIGEATARCARRGDWGQACRLLGATLGAAAAPAAVLVLEGAEHLRRGRPAALDLVGPVLGRPCGMISTSCSISGAQWDHRRLAPHGRGPGAAAAAARSRCRGAYRPGAGSRPAAGVDPPDRERHRRGGRRRARPRRPWP